MPAHGTWLWEIPIGESLPPDRVKLILQPFGREVVHHNGKVLITRFVFRMKSTHQVRLSDGRLAVITIAVRPGSATLAPTPILTIEEMVVPPVDGKLPPKLWDLPLRPKLTPLRKAVFILYEFCLHATFLGLAVYCLWHPWTFMTPVQLVRIPLRTPSLTRPLKAPGGIFLILEALFCLIRGKTWKQAKKANTPYLETLYSFLFQAHWNQKQVAQKTPVPGKVTLVACLVGLVFCFGMGIWIPLIAHTKDVWTEKLAKLGIFILFNGGGFWLSHFLWVTWRDSKLKGIGWGEEAEGRIERSEARRIERGLSPKLLTHRLKMSGSILASVFGLFVLLGISTEAKEAFMWRHRSLGALFFLNGLFTFVMILSTFGEFLYFPQASEPKTQAARDQS